MMTVTAPTESRFDLLENRFQQSSAPNAPQAAVHSPLLQAVIAGLMDGVMIVTEIGNLVQANPRARQICHVLEPRSIAAQRPPAEVWRVCQALIESRDLFPDQRIIPESELVLDSGVNLRIRVQWLGFAVNQHECLLITLEDREEVIQNVAIIDTRKYGLTRREGEIWQLRLRGCSYREISDRLYITLNTVKKHVKSILSKRRAVEDEP